ncbi:MAG: signal recognition particle protein [Actinobacteria bacterium]|nr:MAG: signal recognition particle protein [Actinomycetota bacterium]
MFESLTSRLQNIFSKITSRGLLKEADVEAALREIRLALLEADVNYKVVKELTESIKSRAVGQDILESLKPGEQVIKIVNEELTSILGKTTSTVELGSKPPTVLMLVGLQGSGKTSTVAKLALHFRKKGNKPLMVAADTYRPAAIEQLKTLGNELNMEVFTSDTKPLDIAKSAIDKAKKGGFDLVIIDTAGRLHNDKEMMNELVEIRGSVKPHNILLVVDAMTGQDAVNVAQSFKEKLDFDGLILTKMDGDARGGAALSINKMTGAPIKFITTGEKTDALEVFHPDRMASRILGMGDILSLIEKAQETTDAKKAAEMEKKLFKAQFTLDDLFDQLQQVKKMGPINQVLEKMPGINKMPNIAKQVDEKQLTRIEAIIQSMTKEERNNPQVIKSSRKKRIANGSGTNVSDVNQLLKQFFQTKKLISTLGKNKNKLIGKNMPFNI